MPSTDALRRQQADIRQALVLNDLIPATVEARMETGPVTLFPHYHAQSKKDLDATSCVDIDGMGYWSQVAEAGSSRRSQAPPTGVPGSPAPDR